MVEGNAKARARRPAAAFIPAVHQQRPTSTRHQAAVHSLTSTSALRPLQREEFLAKLPKVIFHALFGCIVLHQIHYAYGRRFVQHLMYIICSVV